MSPCLNTVIDVNKTEGYIAISLCPNPVLLTNKIEHYYYYY